jgi:phosphoglycerate dehydrogenase-like enzyme
VWVCNNAGANAPSVAEHVFLLALALSRHFVYHRERATRGPWENRKYENRELRGRTLGIVGLGHCGKAVARRARAFGMRVCVNDIRALSPEECLQREVSPVSLRTLLGTSDIVSLHVPLTSKTRRMIRAETLSWMKPDSLLVNTSRGGVVCERDLVESLERGIPAAAALDVFEKEPLEETSPLKRMPNVIVTPHCGASRESVGRTLERILDNVTRVSRGSAPAGVAVDYEDFEDASAGS